MGDLEARLSWLIVNVHKIILLRLRKNSESSDCEVHARWISIGIITTSVSNVVWFISFETISITWATIFVCEDHQLKKKTSKYSYTKFTRYLKYNNENVSSLILSVLNIWFNLPIRSHNTKKVWHFICKAYTVSHWFTCKVFRLKKEGSLWLCHVHVGALSLLRRLRRRRRRRRRRPLFAGVRNFCTARPIERPLRILAMATTQAHSAASARVAAAVFRGWLQIPPGNIKEVKALCWPWKADCLTTTVYANFEGCHRRGVA